MAGNSTIRRARNLVALGAFAPPVVYDVYAVWWRIWDDEFGTADVVQLGGLTVIFWLVGLWLFVLGRKHPGRWLYPAQVGGLVLLWLVFHLDRSPHQDEQAAYWAGTIATIAAVAAVAVLPPWRARKMVLADLSQEIVDSDLVIPFKPRRGGQVGLAVDQHEITAFDEARSSDRLHVSVPLTDVTEVTTWTESGDTEWALPGGDRTVSLPAGELIGFSVPDGQVVVAVRDAAKAKRFVEARVARRRAAVPDR